MRLETETPVAVRFERWTPSALEWAGETWHVIDQPTPLMGEVEWLHPLITHPPERRIGWRFTARPETGGEARIFDVLAREHGWRLCCVWD